MKLIKKHSFNKVLINLLIVLSLLFCFGCGTKIDDIQFNSKIITINIGEQAIIDYSISPNDAGADNIEVINSNNEILRNLHDNVYEGISDGIATLTIVYNNKEYGKCNVVVKPIELQSIGVSIEEVYVDVGKTYSPDILFYPSDATNKEYTLSSNNEQVAKIDNNKVVGVNKGVAKIVVVGDNNVKTSFLVNVIPVVTSSVSSTKSIENNKQTSNVAEGQPSVVETTTETYMLNTNTKKFHRTNCSDISKMKESNKQLFTGSRDEVINKGYSPCGHCKP